MLPPIWFAARYAAIAGAGGDVFVSYGHVGLIAALAAALAATLVHFVPATLIGRRALESRPRERASLLTSLAGCVATLVLRRPGIRSIFMFAVASGARSPRHTMILATSVTATEALLLRIIRRRRLHRQPIQFEIVAADRFEALNLSEAVN